MPVLEQVLAAVRQQLQRERWATHARQAAWGSAVVALLAVVVHLWIRPVGTTGMLAAVVLPWLLAALQTAATRPDRAACAQWADRHLGGQSGFCTLQELAGSQAAGHAAAAKHLERWLDGVSRSGLARLHEMPLASSLARPLAAALVCASLAAALLQVPTRPLAAPTTSQVAPITAADRADSVEQPGRESPAVAAVARAPDEDEARMASEPDSGHRSRTAAQPSQQQADAGDYSTTQAGEPPAGTRTAARAAATGREAGDSVDPGGDAALVAPWQGNLAARLREIAAAQPPPAGRAGPSESAEYDATAVMAGALPGGVPPEAAAAEPPPAAASLTLGPAEQAYVRAYWAGTGARP